MAEEWQGRRDIALLREPHASNTAENAVRSLALVRTLEGASEVVLVCSIRHFPRVRFFFRRLYRRYGLVDRATATSCGRSRRRPLVWHELSSITRMARDRRRALRLLDERAERASPFGLPWPGGRRRTARSRWACSSTRAAGRRRSRATSRTRSIARGWPVTLRQRVARRERLRSATQRSSSRASTRSPGAYDDAVARFERGEDPMDAPFPMHPSYEQRARRARPLVHPRLARAGSADGRGLGAADRRLARAAARLRCCTCTT